MAALRSLPGNKILACQAEAGCPPWCGHYPTAALNVGPTLPAVHRRFHCAPPGHSHATHAILHSAQQRFAALLAATGDVTKMVTLGSLGGWRGCFSGGQGRQLNCWDSMWRCAAPPWWKQTPSALQGGHRCCVCRPSEHWRDDKVEVFRAATSPPSPMQHSPR